MNYAERTRAVFSITMELIDTHCHLSFNAFSEDWEAAIERARAAGVRRMISVGAAVDTTEKAIVIAERSEGVYATVGIHPTHTEDDVFDEAWFREKLAHPKVVAVGETGIDYYRIDQGRKEEIVAQQEVLFKHHVRLAKVAQKPVILHSRDGKTEQGEDAYEHVFRLISDIGYTQCVLHCYGGKWQQAKKFIDIGCLLSFTGIVTFKNAGEDLREVVKNIPPDRYMIETDSPYLAPEPYRGKQNEPAYVAHVARGIAAIRGVSFEQVAEETTGNARRFFGI